MTGPSDNPWLNALFGDVEVATLFSAKTSLRQMLEIETAWTRAIAPADVAERIGARLADFAITPEDLTEDTIRDGLPVPGMVRRIKQVIPEADHVWLHSGLTSQDVIDTSLMLSLQQLFPILRQRLDALIDALGALLVRDGPNGIMGVTRMQPALAISTGDRVKSWRRPLQNLASQLPGLMDGCAIVQLGGPVGTRGGKITAVTGDRFAQSLGLRDPGYAWHSDRTILAEVAAFLARITGVIGKIGQDITLMALNEQDRLILTGGGGSSAMPHKQNPVRAEILVALAQRSSGDLAQMHQALAHELERSGTAWMLEWLALPAIAETCGRSLLTSHTLIGQITCMGGPEIS